MSFEINWLHISDLHLRRNTADEQNDLLLTLSKDIRDRYSATNTPLDFVLFSGDVVFDGSDFDLVEKTLGVIYEAILSCQLNEPQLFIVPGNHDVARTITDSKFSGQGDASAVEEFFINKFKTNEGLPDSLWDSDKSEEMREYINDRFSNYSGFLRTCKYIKHDTLDRSKGIFVGDFAHKFEKDGFELGIIGLNSSLFQVFAGDFEKKIELRARQAFALFGDSVSYKKWLADNHTNILLTHHPLDWFSPESKKSYTNHLKDTELMPLHFSGHVHIPATAKEAYFGAKAEFNVSAPSLFGYEKYVGYSGKASKEESRIEGLVYCRISSEDMKHARLDLAPRIRRRRGADPLLVPDYSFDLDEFSKGLTYIKRGFDFSLNKSKEFNHQSKHDIESNDLITSAVQEEVGIQNKELFEFIGRIASRNDDVVRISSYSENAPEKPISYDNEMDCLTIAALSLDLSKKRDFLPASNNKGYEPNKMRLEETAEQCCKTVEKALSDISKSDYTPDVLIVNELSYPSLDESPRLQSNLRRKINRVFSKFAEKHSCLIVGGSYVDKNFYNVSPVFGPNGVKLKDHARQINPVSAPKVRTPSSNKIFTYPFKTQKLSIAICRDTFDPKLIFKLMSKSGTGSGSIQFLAVPAFTQTVRQHEDLIDACVDISLASDTIVCLVDRSCDEYRETESVHLFLSGCSAADSDVRKLVVQDDGVSPNTRIYKVDFKGWKSFREGLDIPSGVSAFNKIVRERRGNSRTDNGTFSYAGPEFGN